MCGVLPAVRTHQVDGFPTMCQAEKGGDIKEIEGNFVQESVIYQFVLREMSATYFQVCKS